MLKDYVKLSSKELLEIFYIAGTLSVLFSLTFMRFPRSGDSFVNVLIVFFIFLFLMFSGRLLFMKYVAYRNGFEINLNMTFFDRYWFRNYDTISYTMDGKLAGVKTPKITGVPMPLISIFLFILTLGFLIFPSMWRYSLKKIPHRFIGTKSKFEHPFSQTEEITRYRYSKVLFSGFLFYLFLSFFLKVISQDFNLSYFHWFIFIIYYVAFFSLIPIIGTEGFEFWLKGKFGWICTLVILFLGLLSILIFSNVLLIVVSTLVCVFIVLLFMMWRGIIDIS